MTKVGSPRPKARQSQHLLINANRTQKQPSKRTYTQLSKRRRKPLPKPPSRPLFGCQLTLPRRSLRSIPSDSILPLSWGHHDSLRQQLAPSQTQISLASHLLVSCHLHGHDPRPGTLARSRSSAHASSGEQCESKVKDQYSQSIHPPINRLGLSLTTISCNT